MTTANERRDDVDVSVLVPVRNEARHIHDTVARMQAQAFEGTIELLFADGRSEDGTRQILDEIAALDPRVRVLDNPRRTAASGLNVCLRAARGEFVARMDAHTFYTDHYLVAGVDRLRRGDTDWVSGPAVPRAIGNVSKAVQLALRSWLGRGGSRKWSETPGDGQESELDTGVFGGVWRRATLLDIGGWDERWPVNQDSEMAARFLQRGARLVCLPEMVGHYIPRDTISGLARQYFRYGFYRARTFRHHPGSMRRSHWAAPSLTVALACAAVGPRPLRTATRLICGAYLATLAAATVDAASRRGAGREIVLLPVVAFVMHVSWGAGALAGMWRFGPPIVALMRLLRARDHAAGPPTVTASVYAPSLGGE